MTKCVFPVFVFILSILKSLETRQEIIPYSTQNNCSKSQYFDMESFKCTPCDSGFTVTENQLSCGCFGSNKYLGISKNSSKPQCLQCKPTEYVTNDGFACVPRNCFNLAKGKITCSICKKNQIRVTNHQNGTVLPVVECITCAPGYAPSIDKTFCQLCSVKTTKHNLNMCDCNEKQFTLINDVCIPKSFIKNTTIFQMKTASGELFPSIYFEKYWMSSNYLCSLNNASACQMAANICVLSLYSNSANSPCTKWKNTKLDVSPVLMYGEDESYAVLFRKKISAVYNLMENSENNKIDIIALSINANGTVQEFIDKKTKWLNPCPSIWKTAEQHILKFGKNYRHKCSIGVQQLISESETIFYEAFIKYIDKESKDSPPQLHAIPVLIKSDLIDFNKENDVNSWQLVRRFFIFDKISGLTNSNGKEMLKYFRYAKDIEIKIRIRHKGRGERSKIYPPLLKITYAEASENHINENVYVNLNFAVNFELDGVGMVNGMEIAVGSLSAFGLLYSILQTWSYSRRSGKLGLELKTLLRFFIFVSSNLANIFFIVSFGASIYSFLIYKTQKVVYVVPPSNRDEYVVQTYLIVAFALKIVEVFAVNWSQINVDITFVDWERPNLSVNELGLKPPNVQIETQVSFWRPYFVANEWNEIQTLRKISLPLHLVCCVFILEIFGASSWAYIGIEINSEQSSDHMSSPAYQFALSGLIFLLMYFIQLTLSTFIYERFIKNAILDFMDVCSIANVSILILEEALYGYYLHGRCVHASCDTDVRGLQPGLPHRAFSVRCTPEFRMYFSRLTLHMTSQNIKWQWQHHINIGNDQTNINSSTVTGIDSARRPGSKSSKRGNSESVASITASSLPPEIEHREQAAKIINKFLTAFLDHALEDLDYEIREKRFIERLLDIELTNEANYKTVLLYNPTGDSQSFQRSIWYGQEWTLATFDLYLFCMVQILTGNYVLAALINAILWKILSICRQFGGQKNLAKKTLIDERFLI